MKATAALGLFVMLSFMLAACAPGSSVEVTTPTITIQLRMPGPNPMVNQPDSLGLVARGGAGLWHGIIAPITLVISFFNSEVKMYEVHNAGSEYDFGFLLGLAIVMTVLSVFIRMRR